MSFEHVIGYDGNHGVWVPLSAAGMPKPWKESLELHCKSRLVSNGVVLCKVTMHTINFQGCFKPFVLSVICFQPLY